MINFSFIKGANKNTHRYTKFLVPERYRQSVGDYTYGNPAIWGEGSDFKIGRYCSFAREVTFVLGGHRVDWVTTYPFSGAVFNDTWPDAKHIKGHPTSKGDIIIKNDVWVGFGATILSGVTIGNGAVIGAKALVTKDIAPYSVVAGNPAKELKKRFSTQIISDLEKIKWWDWPEEKIRKFIPLLLSDNIQAFIHAAKSNS